MHVCEPKDAFSKPEPSYTINLTARADREASRPHPSTRSFFLAHQGLRNTAAGISPMASAGITPVAD